MPLTPDHIYGMLSFRSKKAHEDLKLTVRIHPRITLLLRDHPFPQQPPRHVDAQLDIGKMLRSFSRLKLWRFSTFALPLRNVAG